MQVTIICVFRVEGLDWALVEQKVHFYGYLGPISIKKNIFLIVFQQKPSRGLTLGFAGVRV